MSSDGPLFHFDAPEKAHEINHRTLSVENLIDRQSRDGRHLWSIGLFFALEDPEASLDDMTCGADNLVAVSPITCAWCGEPYGDKTPIARRDLPCPNNQPL